jgi:hypothetical protein
VLQCQQKGEISVYRNPRSAWLLLALAIVVYVIWLALRFDPTYISRRYPWAKKSLHATSAAIGWQPDDIQKLPDGRTRYIWRDPARQKGRSRTLTLPYRSPEDVQEF